MGFLQMTPTASPSPSHYLQKFLLKTTSQKEGVFLYFFLWILKDERLRRGSSGETPVEIKNCAFFRGFLSIFNALVLMPGCEASGQVQVICAAYSTKKTRVPRLSAQARHEPLSNAHSILKHVELSLTSF